MTDDETRKITSGASMKQIGQLLAAAAEGAPREGESSASPGSPLGPYRLVKILGEGGFSVVYLAEQSHPIRRRVALKILKIGMDTRQVIARFEAEKQALAMMEHPGIAKVFDAGATDSGRPYFVMELVEGEPITRYCDENKLPAEQRLELFAQVCDAVQHAHQKGVIHRDIKPSNVLVATRDGKPVAKVIDFGIAKATACRLTEKTLVTQEGQLLGTPEYMSPEQAAGDTDQLDARTDVYSLGALLFHLLTGELPHDTSGKPWDVYRRVAEQEVRRPRSVSRAIDKDIEAILLKALARNPDHRYASAADLGRDIHNYLTNEPLTARKPTTMYFLRRRIGKYRSHIITGVVVFALLSIVGAYAYYRSPALPENPGPPSLVDPGGDWKVFQTLDIPEARVDLDALQKHMGTAAKTNGGFVEWSRRADWYAIHLPGEPKPPPVKPFANSLLITFRINADGHLQGTVDGPDEDVLAVLAPCFTYASDGKWNPPGAVAFWEPGPHMTTLFGMLWREYALLKKVKGIVSGGPEVVLDYVQGDLRYVPNLAFAGGPDTEIRTRFDQPVWVIYTAVIRWNVEDRAPKFAAELSEGHRRYWQNVFDRWYPRGRPYPGTTSRSLSIAYKNATAGWLHGIAQMDNRNHAEISLDGTQVLTKQDDWGTSYGFRKGMLPGQVAMKGSTLWSAYGIDFGMAVLADNVTFSNLQEFPGTGTIKNPLPLVYKIRPDADGPNKQTVRNEK